MTPKFLGRTSCQYFMKSSLMHFCSSVSGGNVLGHLPARARRAGRGEGSFWRAGAACAGLIVVEDRSRVYWVTSGILLPLPVLGEKAGARGINLCTPREHAALPYPLAGSRPFRSHLAAYGEWQKRQDARWICPLHR